MIFGLQKQALCGWWLITTCDITWQENLIQHFSSKINRLDGIINR